MKETEKRFECQIGTFKISLSNYPVWIVLIIVILLFVAFLFFIFKITP